MATVSISAPHAPTYAIPKQYQATVDKFNASQGISSKGSLRTSPSSSSTPSKATSTPSVSVSQPVTTVSNVVTSGDSYPSFFSIEGQKLALKRVVAVLNPFDTDKLSWTNPFTGQAVAPATGVKTVTRAAEVGALAYGGALAYAAAGGGGASAAVTTLGYGTTRVAPVVAGNSLRDLAIAGGVGLGAGMLLSRGGEQNVMPSQNQGLNNYPVQETQQNPTIAPQQVGPGGFTQGGQGNSLRYQQSQDTFTTYNAQASPYQSTPIDQTAGQSTSASQGENNMLLIALAVAAVLVVSK